MRQREILAYARKHLPNELQLMQTGDYLTACPELTPAEKAFVHHYSHTGSEEINFPLYANPGAELSPLAAGLAAALTKLPPYVGIVRSGAWLEQLGPHMLTEADITIAWPAFLSASKSAAVANQFLGRGRKNCLFLISSQTGRHIEPAAYYGPNGPDPGQNEQEVVFLPGTRFAILDIRQATGYFEIVLEEI